MNCFSDNPRDIGITVIGGLTGQGDMTQAELDQLDQLNQLDQKIEDVKESLRAKKPLIMDEFWNIQKSDAIDELREKHPPFKVGNDN